MEYVGGDTFDGKKMKIMMDGTDYEVSGKEVRSQEGDSITRTDLNKFNRTLKQFGLEMVYHKRHKYYVVAMKGIPDRMPYTDDHEEVMERAYLEMKQRMLGFQ